MSRKRPTGDKHAIPPGEAEANLNDYVEAETIAPKAKRGRGRQPGFRMSEAHRVKIQNSNIITALLKHVDGKLEMSTTQVTAGLGLLRKVLPDLQAVTIGGDPKNPLEHNHRVDFSRMPDNELSRLLGDVVTASAEDH
jgi:hypothetical protein